MKTILSAALAVLILWGCAPGPEAEVHRVIIHSEAPILTLNYGERWQTDDYTDLGVRLLQEAVWQHDSRTLESYNNLGKSLEELVVPVLKNTTMQGQANDMLHVLLMPVAQDAKAMERNDLAVAQEAHKRISERLKQYEHYFK